MTSSAHTVRGGASPDGGADQARPSASLTRSQRRFLALLALPVLGLSVSVTVVSSTLPVLIEDFSGPALTGLLVGAEGIFALVIPPLVGARSSTGRGGGSRRRRYIVLGCAACVLGLVLLPHGESVVVVAALLALFYAGYFVYYTPYWALYPALVPARERGRSQSAQGLWRSVGLGLALVGGGALIAVWEPLPFLIAAIVLTALTVVFLRRIEEPSSEAAGGDEPARTGLAATWKILRERPRLRAVAIANSLWETAVAGLRAFVLLFLTVGLGRSAGATAAILAGVAGVALVAAPVAGSLADRFGHLRLMRGAALLFAVGLLGPVLLPSFAALLTLPLVAFAAVTLMTLPYSLMMSEIPGGEAGAGAGVFGSSRGAGLIAGPILAGLSVELAGPLFEDSGGYGAVFPVAALAVLASLLPLARLGSDPA